MLYSLKIIVWCRNKHIYEESCSYIEVIKKWKYFLCNMSLQKVAIWTKYCRQLGRNCCLSIRVSINVINRQLTWRERERERKREREREFVLIILCEHLRPSWEKNFLQFRPFWREERSSFSLQSLKPFWKEERSSFSYKDFSHSGERNVPHFL